MLFVSSALAECPAMDDLSAFVPAFVAARPDRPATLAAVDAARSAVDAIPRLEAPMIEVMTPPVALVEGMPGARIRVEQTLPLWGMVGLERDMARAAVDAESARVTMMDRDMGRMAAMLWTDLWAMNAETQLMARERARMEALREATVDQYRAGRATALDTSAMDVEIATMNLDIRRMEGAREGMRARLGGLLGCPSLALPPVDAGIAAPSSGAAEAPERVEGAAMIAMAEAERAMAGRATLPMIGWMVDLDTMVPAHEQLMVGVSVEVPLTWRATRAARDAAEARVRVVTTKVDAELAELEADRAELAATVVSAEQTLAGIEAELVPASARRLAATRAAYAAGTVDLRALLAAEAGDVRVQIERVRTNALRMRAQTELGLLGGVR
jgi:outer membrane protein TolC